MPSLDHEQLWHITFIASPHVCDSLAPPDCTPLRVEIQSLGHRNCSVTGGKGSGAGERDRQMNFGAVWLRIFAMNYLILRAL